jgi:hypothetical protein
MPPPSVEKRAAVFITVDQLRPDTTGHNLVLKVRAVLGSDLMRVTSSTCRSNWHDEAASICYCYRLWTPKSLLTGRLGGLALLLLKWLNAWWETRPA